MRQLELERGFEAGSDGLFLAEPSSARSIALGRVRRNLSPLTAASPTKASLWTDAKSSKRIAAAAVPAPLKASAIEAKLQRVDLT